MSVTVGGASKAFAEAMRCAGYEESTIAQYGKYVRELGRLAEERTGGVYTRELGEEFAGSTVSAVTGVSVNIVFANSAKILSPYPPMQFLQPRQSTFTTSG